MAASVWQRRILRAEELSRRHTSAAEMLGFYIDIARLQETLHQRLCSAAEENPEFSCASFSDPGALCQLVPEFRKLLSLVVQSGPARLVQVARELQQAGMESWSALLADSWSAANHSPSQPQEFLALAFLQPYAELLRSRATPRPNQHTYVLCPFCNRKPGLGVLRPLGEGASRSLICSFCLAEWEFRRIVCPGCGEEISQKLPVFTATDFDYIRVECCDTCKTYIKTVDLAKNGLAEPVVDEIASAALDLWAQDHGDSKLQPNLLGM
jgi:FdhE protein